MKIDKPTFVKCMNAIKEYADKIESLYDDIEHIFGDCEKFMDRADGQTAMMRMLETVCDDNKFIFAYIFDTNWGEWNAIWTNGDREFAFKTLDDLWEVLNYPMPWELKLVLR